MPQSVELPDNLANALAAEASRFGMSMSDYALRGLASASPVAMTVRSGADLVGYWQAEGLVGSRSEIADSQVHARQLRDEAQRRGD